MHFTTNFVIFQWKMMSQWQSEPDFQLFFVNINNVDIGDLFGKVWSGSNKYMPSLDLPSAFYH